ncbi:MAG: hypothetical protein LBS97_02800 [Treponema sp.]|jgi:hypothetical protein|nr:hypothetical protein [Treponema sp.]
MKLKNAKNGIALLLIAAAVVGLVAVGCSQDAEELSSNAEVASVTVAGKTVVLGTPTMDWMEAKESENAGTVFVPAASMTGATVVVNKGQDGQKVYLAAAKPSVMPDFVDTTTTFSFDVLDYLWVEVFSENHDAYKLYAIQVRTTTPVVQDLTLGGRSSVGGTLANGRPILQYGTGLGNYHTDLAQATEGEIWFGDNQASTALALAATPEDPDSTVLVALGAPGASAATLFPAGYTNPETITPVDGNYLYIKATSADSVNGETVYYKVKLVQKTTSFAIGDVTIQGNSGTPVPFTVGAAGTNGFGGGENRGNAANLAADGNGYKNILSTVGAASVNATVAIGTVAPGATVRYGHTDWNAAQEDVESTGHTTLVYQTSPSFQNLPTNEFIAVEVTNGLLDKNWYSFQIRVGGVAALTGLTLSGGTVTPLPDANLAVTGTTAVIYTMSAAGPWSPTVNATVSSGTTGIAYAIALAANTNVTNWTNTSGELANIASAQFVYVRLTQDDQGPAQYYKVALVYGNDAAEITGVTVGGVASSSVGTPKLAAPDAPPTEGNGAITLTGAQSAGEIILQGLSSGATAEYGIAYEEWSGSSPGFEAWNWHMPAAWQGTGAITNGFPVETDVYRNNFLAVRITPEESGLIRYYLIKVTVN